MGPDENPLLVSCGTHLVELQRRVEAGECTEKAAMIEVDNIAHRLRRASSDHRQQYPGLYNGSVA